MRIDTLKTRAEFLRIRGGLRAPTSIAVVEAKFRPQSAVDAADDRPRFGFTVTKKLGNAVVRNRIRRRLKAAVSQIATVEAMAGCDYVIVARSPAHDVPFDDLVRRLRQSFKRIREMAAARPPACD